MEQITPTITQIEQLLSEFEIKYAEKSNMPLDWVSQYKTFQSRNITIENWNTFNSYIHNVLSDTKSSYEFIVSSMNLLFDTLKTINTNDKEHTDHITDLQSYLDMYKDIFNNGVIYLQNITEGSSALSSLKENQKVLSIKHRTSTYVGGKEVQALQMFIVKNGKYQSVYSVEIDYHDLIVKHDSLLETHSKLLTTLQNKVDSIDITNVVYPSDLSDVAFSGNYNDLIDKPNIPTQLSELTNNVGFITNAVSDLINYYKKTETFTKDEIIALLNAIKTIKFEIHTSKDDITNPQTNIIYLIGTQSPYDEYIYLESINDFEQIGSSDIDLSNYVQSDNTLNTDYVVLGNADKKVKTSSYKIETSSLNNSGIPTTNLVQTEIRKYHDIITINGDSGTITNAIDTAYRLIVDENLLVYRRIKNDNNAPIYHSQQVIDNEHIRDYYLVFSGRNYTRSYVENVSHTEFDTLVANTPTEILYNKETKIAQLAHDGQPIGEGVELSADGFTPYFDGSGLVLGDLNHIDSELATKEYVDEKVASGGVSIYTPVREE